MSGQRVAETLRAAKALIATPETWIKGSYRDSDGCMCADGALMMADQGTTVPPALSTAYWDAYDLLCELTPQQQGLIGYNDLTSTTHADVMSLFDRAIAAAERGDS